jgi:hypothetical protein
MHLLIKAVELVVIAGAVFMTVMVLAVAINESRAEVIEPVVKQPWDEWSHWEDDVLVVTDEPCCEPDYSYDLGRYVHTGKNCRGSDYEYLRKAREWNS